MTDSGSEAVGRIRVREDVLDPWPVQAMLGLLDRGPDGPSRGDPLPLGWHWLYFREALRASSLGPDGHEVRGAFLPSVDLPRRMWAGGSLRLLEPARIGHPAQLRSEILDVVEKSGRSGRLVFVTVGHTLFQDGPCVEEEQVIVYRDGTSSAGATRIAADPQAGVEWRESFQPSVVTLFRFSALTYNAHRIHYDREWATEREGYRGLLVHAPLTALVLLDAAQRRLGAVSTYRYRALAPLFADESMSVVGVAAEEGPRAPERVVEARGPAGSVAMRGWVGLAG